MIVGELVGVEDGAGDIVGLLLGVIVGLVDDNGVGLLVGLDVTYRLQTVAVGSTQVGVKESNCWTVSNTEENGHNTPLLLLTKFISFRNVFPKTTISDDPTKLSLKHVFSTSTGPSDSTI